MVADEEDRRIGGNRAIDLELYPEDPADVAMVPVRKAPRPPVGCLKQYRLNRHQRQRQAEKSREYSEATKRSRCHVIGSRLAAGGLLFRQRDAIKLKPVADEFVSEVARNALLQGFDVGV